MAIAKQCAITIILSTMFLNAFACSKGASNKQDIFRADESMEQEFNTHHIGRFRVSTPTDLTPKYSRQSIYFLKIKSVLKYNSSDDLHWEQFIENQSYTTILPMPFTDGELKAVSVPDKLILAAPIDNKDATTLILAQSTLGEHVIQASYLSDRGSELDIIDLIAEVFASFGAGAKKGFFIGTGTLNEDLSLTENAELTLSSAERPSISIEFEVAVAGKTLTDDPFDNMNSIMGLFSGDDASMKVIKREQRKVAGFDGAETILEAKENNKVLIMYSWFTPGMPEQALQPEISITAEVSKNEDESFREHWNKMLESLTLR